MNMQLLSELWERFPGKGARRSLMMAIASASDARGLCVTTKKELAASARMSRTSTWRSLDALETEGWIGVEQAQVTSGPMKVQLMLAKLEHTGDLPQPSIQRAIPQRCRRSAVERSPQEELIFSPAVIEPMLRSSDSQLDRLAGRRTSASRPPLLGGRNGRQDARSLGPYGRRRRW